MATIEMVHGYSPSLVAEIQAIIDDARDGKIPPNTAYEDICERLIEKQVVTEEVLTCDKVACHPSNRSGMGLNGYNVHRNGAEVDRVGVDFKELNKAAAFQICPIEPKKSEQLNWNRELAKSSKGLLAPLTGRETCMSVGTGHWTAWCRAILAGCKTPIKHVADKDGFLVSERFRKRDSRMAKVLTVGWTWRFFPWQAEVAWNLLPDLAQRALNASHGVSSRSTELEVMCSVAEFCSEGASGDEQRNLADIVESISLAAPPCMPYITSVGRLARLCSGGKEAPFLRFMDRFAKQFGENKALGEEFVTAIADFEFSKTEKIIHMRVSMIVTNLVAEKVVDGIARLLVKSDVDKLKSKALVEQTSANESRIRTAWTIGMNAVNSGMIGEDAFDGIIGQFMVRSILTFLGKQKMGPEKREFKDLDEVRVEFIKAIFKASGGKDVDIGEWVDVDVSGGGDTEPVEDPNDSLGGSDRFRSADEQNDPRAIFEENGFKIGCYVREKGVESKDIYIVQHVGEDGEIKLQLYNMYQSSDLVVKLIIAKFIAGWTRYNGKVPQVLPSPRPAYEMQDMINDSLRSKAFAALMGHESSAEERPLKYVINPSGVVATGNIQKNSMKLAPFTVIANLNAERRPNSVVINVGKSNVFATPLAKPGKIDDKVKYIIVPYWWVEDTHDADQANMRLVAVKVDDITIPVLQNTRVIAERERLYVFKAKDVKKPLVGTQVVRATPAVVPPPPKRAKTVGK